MGCPIPHSPLVPTSNVVQQSRLSSPDPNVSRPTHTLHTRPSTVIKPLPFFHPTRARFHTLDAPEDSTPAGEWSSRPSRKNRIIPQSIQAFHEEDGGEKGGPNSIEARMWHAKGQLKPHLSWDIAFWSAFAFVIGSIAWVINGFLLFLPLIGTGTPEQNGNQAQGWAFIGGTLFEIGAYLMVVESLNSGHDDLFGPALWDVMRTPGRNLDNKEKQLIGKAQKGKIVKRYRWIGLGDFRDIGVAATFIQWMAASIFWISTLTGLPGVIPNLNTSPPVAIKDVFFWTPQVIGGSGFTIASILLMIECQTKWWKLNPLSIGWHVGFWNLVGAIGFTLCGAFGYASLSKTWINYQSVLSTFWGGWAFLIGSTFQLWEAIWKEDPDSAKDGTEE